MKVLSIRRWILWVVLAVLVAIAIYRVWFPRPIPAFNEEALKKLMAE